MKKFNDNKFLTKFTKLIKLKKFYDKKEFNQIKKYIFFLN